MHRYCKRLIEVDLPIKRISAHARREKSIRHGHISTLHIWWARRPLAACRAVICAALWPDPVDLTAWAERGDPTQDEVRTGGGAIPVRPRRFLDEARQVMTLWAQERLSKASQESYARLVVIQKDPRRLDDPEELRRVLLDFIADFANWDNSTDKDYLDTARALTQAAHEALGGDPGTRPLVVDPFAGGGSIPLEALRVGADAFASDLNPVSVLLNKVVLEYIPKYGQRLADEVRKWGEWIKREAEKELAEFYPKDADGATPIAYLWSRTIQCEGPGCGAEVPLIRSLWLAKKANRSVALQLVPNPKAKRVDFQIIIKQSTGWVDQANPKATVENPKFDGAVKRGSATCPCCGYTTQNERVRKQLSEVKGGASTARLFAVVTTKPAEAGRFYRLPADVDCRPALQAADELRKQSCNQSGSLSLVPDELIPTERPSPNARGLSAVTKMGVASFGDLFAPRQALMLATFGRFVRKLAGTFSPEMEKGLGEAVTACLALAVDRTADNLSSLVTWTASGEFQGHTFARQALPIVWDFAECCPLADAPGNWTGAAEWIAKAIEAIAPGNGEPGTVAQASATEHPLPNDAAQAVVTDPPYYDAVPYADLSEYFYVWMRRTLADHSVGLFGKAELPKDEEAIWNPSRIYSKTGKPKDERFYEQQMKRTFEEARRVVAPSGIGVVVFAHKSTAGWEAVLSALIEAGWITTGSWPIDTEREVRTNAIGTASLASSVHLVCRPRENPDGSVRTDEIGDWRDVLQELPRRIHEWMPRLAEEGVVGADAIFACLGPALEIFSRYSCVEKASGETVMLKEYLECVWAAVAKEALTIIFPNADTTGFEEDARLTAMWLWTLNAGNTDAANGESAEEEEADDASDGGAKKAKPTGFGLEYDAARKIAQGLGAHLEDLGSLVAVSGDQARLLPVGERARHLFGTDEGHVAPQKKRKVPQLDLFTVLEQADGAETTSGEARVERQGKTVLDRIHQSMILFAAGRSEALQRFLVEGGVGRDPRFWSLAQALSALYPTHTTEKRWIDGVLARKKGLGF
jgi:putative DNA methylase